MISLTYKRYHHTWDEDSRRRNKSQYATNRSSESLHPIASYWPTGDAWMGSKRISPWYYLGQNGLLQSWTKYEIWYEKAFSRFQRKWTNYITFYRLEIRYLKRFIWQWSSFLAFKIRIKFFSRSSINSVWSLRFTTSARYKSMRFELLKINLNI